MPRRRQQVQLPPFAQTYLEAHPQARQVVLKFHVWLRRSCRPVLALQPTELDAFIAQLAKVTLKPRTRATHRRLALRYFDWLHNQALLPFDSTRMCPRGSPVLPHAVSFLKTLEPTLRPSTLRIYQTSLRRFHFWLDQQDLTLEQLHRSRIEAWLGWLFQKGLHPSSRLQTILHVRVYLRWLEQHQLLPTPADSLLRSKDLPKLPQYLPRPLPPDIDQQLQLRLRKARSSSSLGLLLMRRTGLRIGELRTLPPDCIRVDPRGNQFLKVPLGKLANERLVPLDAQTVKLISRLQRLGRPRRTFLIEGLPHKPIPYYRLTQTLRSACRGLALAEPMTSHRLRHTYATSLLAGGMSLPAVMRLLGHRDYRMTLRYAAITDETVAIEYGKALTRTVGQYALPSSADHDVVSVTDLLNDVLRHIRRLASDHALDPQKARSLEKRLRRIQATLRRHSATRAAQ